MTAAQIGQDILLERRKPQPWSFDRSINIVTVLAFLSLVGAGLGYIRSQETRTTILETTAIELREQDRRLSEELRTQKMDLKEDLREIKTDLKELKGRH